MVDYLTNEDPKSLLKDSIELVDLPDRSTEVCNLQMCTSLLRKNSAVVEPVGQNKRAFIDPETTYYCRSHTR
ncbi:hypothetical protein ARMGADRAFT_1004081 [Armillaria gallica]|uniref:Uncharacterized protein n=1 Tax=Armillaria gallica TaxID=47427 RepID=A0A2H3EAG7_ARMGA|nr:hypothetical protein ARMGADRAFT_1004081 [Armillaria gallica]